MDGRYGITAFPRTALSGCAAVRLEQIAALMTAFFDGDGVWHAAVITPEQGRALLDMPEVLYPFGVTEWP